MPLRASDSASWSLCRSARSGIFPIATSSFQSARDRERAAGASRRFPLPGETCHKRRRSSPLITSLQTAAGRAILQARGDIVGGEVEWHFLLIPEQLAVGNLHAL